MIQNQFHKDEISQKIRDLIAEKMTTPTPVCAPDALMTDLGLDSLDLVEIVLEIEDTFNCQIDDARFELMQTVDELIEYVYLLKVSKH